ncbi:MAG: LysM domain-containing protein, partial [Bacillota bacterium]
MIFLFVYYVQPGDTLYQIARRYNTTVQRLLELNNLPDPDMLTVGMKLQIDAPAPGEAGEGAGSDDPYVA